MSHASAVRVPHATPAAEPHSSPKADLLFDAFYAGVMGASAIMLFFLGADAIRGLPLFTPSLIGTVLFTSASAPAVTEVRLDMVAYFTLVHFAVFIALAACISAMCRRWALVEGHPIVIVGVVFTVLTVALLLADLTLMPGVVSALGLASVLAGNAVAGVVMAAFIRWSHRQ